MNTVRLFAILKTLSFAILIGMVLPSCRSTKSAAADHPPLPTVARVDLKRYSGMWHEVSRLPNRFQKSCLRSTAEYTPLPGGTVQVRNTCYKAKGRTGGITGTATPVPGSNNARLRVKFGGFAALAPVPEDGNYWIIALDPQYRWAMVGTPDRKFLWMLARQPQLPFPVYRQLKQQASDLGFDVGKLIPEDKAPAGLVQAQEKARAAG
ncbi:MAG: hypothetical protein JWL81_2530 [Verrucomicrobiales bacterium]|nr:hypothetical protein [Verrucomicrobiales bacterium]